MLDRKQTINQRRNKMKRLALILMLVIGLLFMASCSEDDESSTQPTPVPEWVGTWLSAGDDVAPLLVALFQYDSVRVEMTQNQIVRTHSHVAGGAWSTVEGTYKITEAASGDIHTAEFNYAPFDQAGIIQIIAGTPKTMKLEVVQIRPDIGAVPRTPDSGFGSDVALGTLNIQNYVKED